MGSEKKSKKDKELLQEFENHSKDIRQQLAEQLKCLENRLEIQTAIATEMQEFYRRKAELEAEYSRNLEKLVKSTWSRHKQERQRREHWDQFSTYNCWAELLEITRKQSHDHGILAEICGFQVINRLTEILDNQHRMFKKCREIGSESHEDILKTLYELQKAMKTYHQYQQDSRTAEEALKKVQSQKSKVEQQLSGKSLSGSRKFKKIEKQEDEKQEKYSVNKLKALHARNEYLLNIEVANAAINKYFSDDVSDLMDCMDFGYHNSIRGTVMIYQSAHCNMRNTHHAAFDQLNDVISKMDPLSDKQRFLEINNQAFMLPKKFEFQSCRGDEVRQISAQKPVQDQLFQSYKSSQKVLEQLKLDNDETWKSLEATEKSLTELVNRKDIDVTSLFMDENSPTKSPMETERKRQQRLETEGYYLGKFRSYTLSNNRIARLQAKYSAIQKALGEDHVSVSGGRVRMIKSPEFLHMQLMAELRRPPSLPPKPKKRRIGRNATIGQAKLFGGSLEEYIDATGQEIPIIIRSCIRVLNLYGMHHQGIFRIPGSQVEINDIKNAYEKGDDPLTDTDDACERINSAAGVLKLYFRELKPPLFPLQLFDELVACSRLDEAAKIDKIKELVASLPRSIIIVMRYLFAFLNHLSEYSDENMMDPYNLAICFGPTLIPIPPDRDQVTFQNNVNEIIKTIIRNHDEILIIDGGEQYEKCIVDMGQDSIDGMEEEEEEETSSVQSDDDEDTEVYEATALYDFNGRTGRELSFKKGDNLLLYTKASSEWWEGAFAGKEGLVPMNYVTLKHQSEDKKSLGSDDSKSSSSLSSLAAKSTEPSVAKTLSSVKLPILETEIQDSVVTDSSSTSVSSIMSQSMMVSTTRHGSQSEVVSTTRHGSQSEVVSRRSLGSIGELKRQSSTPETTTDSQVSNSHTASEDLQSMDSVLAEIMSDVRSLEMQQSSEKPLSLPIPKIKLTSKHTPDLVLDLPEGSNSSSPGSGPDSPTLSAAETFAKSNQGTMKKAASMPRSVISSDLYGSDVKSESTAPILSTFQQIKTGQVMTTSMHHGGRKYSLDEQKLKCASLPPMQTFSPQMFVPPIAEKPKPAIKVKPQIMKKPLTRSPEVSRKLQETNLDAEDLKSPSGVNE